MAAISIEGVGKSFGSVRALDGLTLTVPEGELYGLLGPNGAGKTTTMAILTGQLQPDEGNVSVLGIDPVADPVGVRERVGILPEKESPPSFLTPREYFRFVGTVRDIPETRVEEQIDIWGDRLGFTGVLDTLATDLSRGQQQKVMIAAAFLHEPAAVFIDEPLANLDPIVQERVKRYLATYRERGNTVVVSTHNVEVAAEICSTVGIVHEGRLVEAVQPAELAADADLLSVFVDRVEGDPGASPSRA